MVVVSPSVLTFTLFFPLAITVLYCCMNKIPKRLVFFFKDQLFHVFNLHGASAHDGNAGNKGLKNFITKVFGTSCSTET